MSHAWLLNIIDNARIQPESKYETAEAEVGIGRARGAQEDEWRHTTALRVSASPASQRSFALTIDEIMHTRAYVSYGILSTPPLP